jgi:hypothetical protein
MAQVLHRAQVYGSMDVKAEKHFMELAVKLSFELSPDILKDAQPVSSSINIQVIDRDVG